MKIEIWSDVMCPFCYIGKKHLEQALAQLSFASEIELVWKSYQLNPNYHNTEGEDLYSYLSRSKGMSLAQVKQMTTQVVAMGQAAGIVLRFDTNIPANSFDAHRLLHLAAKFGKQNDAEELLFYAHFTEGKDVAKHEVLLDLGVQIGLDRQLVNTMLQSDEQADALRYDIYEAQQLGIRAVPFFLINKKYALSGAQPVAAFVDALKQSYQEWSAEKNRSMLKNMNLNDANSCEGDSCIF